MDTCNPDNITATNDVEIVRLFGKPEAAKHYAMPVEGEPHHYRLMCSGRVIDAMAHGGALEHPTCKSCQRMDDPLDVETACHRVALALGYEGACGGWIYRSKTSRRAICQGWGRFAAIRRSSFAAAGMIVRNANGDGYYVDMEAVAAVNADLQAGRGRAA